MLRGRFGDTTGRPYIEARLILPRLDNLTYDVSFLVDTGADRSLLLPADGLAMGLDYSRLRGPTESVGIGGSAKTYEEPAALVFSEPGRLLHVYQMNLKIAAPRAAIMDLPSLVGRDIIDRWRMTYNPARNRLLFHAWSADFTFPISGRKQHTS